MKLKTIISLVCVLALLGSMIVGCAGTKEKEAGETEGKATEEIGEKPKGKAEGEAGEKDKAGEKAVDKTGKVARNETLIVDVLSGRVGTPDNFNVWVQTWRNPDRGIQQLMLEPLWMVEYVTGEVINALAEEPPKYNEDFTKMTVKLREGMYWSDGVEITAADIVYGVQLVKETEGLSYHTEFNTYVDKVYEEDKYTVVFELKMPNSRFHTFFVDRWGAFRPFPKHVFEKAGDPLTFTFNTPVSSGPYVLKDFDPGGYWTRWELREDWDRTPTGKLYGKPAPKEVVYYYYGTPEKKVLAQAQHELDMTDLTSETLKAIIEKSQTSRAYRKEYPWVVNVDPCITGILLNTDKFPFNLKDVRWALTLSIDIVEAIGTAFDGMATMGAMHIPPTPVYIDWYYKPMEDWLKNFTLDIQVDGQPFKPYDPDAPLRLAEYAKSRGYKVPTDTQELREIFGLGWWKYAPDVAEKLLERNGFKRDKDGKWLLPDGTPWKITMVTGTNPAAIGYRNVFAVQQLWKKFGIDVEVVTLENTGTVVGHGDFDASGDWPAIEPWGGHPDLYRTLRMWHSKYYVPSGEQAVGHASRWNNPEMDKIIDEMEKLQWDDPRNLELGMEGLKIAIEEMPSIPLVGYPGIVSWDEYYWTNYPGAENPYCQPYHHWPNFKYMLPFLKPSGK
ncbi:MAG: ABC transporter substrate-binding protein [Thermoanaerobacterium sp.]|nr:ABC transporter substrate-binding protein [Thermoanaerobacterium sp.]